MDRRKVGKCENIEIRKMTLCILQYSFPIVVYDMVEHKLNVRTLIIMRINVDIHCIYHQQCCIGPQRIGYMIMHTYCVYVWKYLHPPHVTKS